MTWLDSTADMLMVHMGGSASVLDGKLVVSGGYDEVDSVYKLTGGIEVYDVAANQWQIIGSMPQPVFWHKCSSVYR